MPRTIRPRAPQRAVVRNLGGQEEGVLAEMQAALFARTVVIENGRPRKMAAISAYLAKLSTEVAQKKRGSAAERLFYVKKLDQVGKFDDEPVVFISPQSIEFARQARAYDWIRRTVSIHFILMIDDVRKQFDVGDSDEPIIPNCLDVELGMEAIRRQRRRQRRSDGSYEVGHCKPPKSSQWKKGESGNPQGRKPRGLWDELAESLLDQQTVRKSDGRRVKRTRIAIEVSQSLTAAMEGDRSARRSIRGIVDLLDQHGMLFEPPPPPKRRRRPRNPEARFSMKMYNLAVCRKLKIQVVREHSKRYGKVEEFFVHTERLIQVEELRAEAPSKVWSDRLEDMMAWTAMDPKSWLLPGEKRVSLSSSEKSAPSELDEGDRDFEQERRELIRQRRATPVAQRERSAVD